MKNLISTTNLLLMTLGALFILSCSPEDGEDGVDGAQGPQGVTGNADITLYEYGEVTFTSSKDFLLTNMPRTKIDSSLVLMYYNPSNESETAWYPVPGTGSSGTYMTRNFWYQSGDDYIVGLRTQNFDGTSNTTSKTFIKTRIFIAPAFQVLTAGKSEKTKLNDIIDINDYYGVCDYFGLPYF